MNSSQLCSRRNRSLSILWVLMVMDTYFVSAFISPFFIFVRVLSFMIFCFVTRVLGLGVFFGMVGCLLLLVLVGFPLAASVDDVACARLERLLLGSSSEEVCREWVPSDHFLDRVASSNVSDHPDVTDGSFVLDELSGIGVAGVVLLLSEVWCWVV